MMRRTEDGMAQAKRFLRVVETASGKVVREIDVTGDSEGKVERVERGLLRNMDREHFYVADTANSDEDAEPEA